MELTPAVKAKCELENRIANAIYDFEIQTEYIVDSISIERIYMKDGDCRHEVYSYEITAEIND